MSLPTPQQLEKEIAETTDPEVKRLLQTKLDHVRLIHKQPINKEEVIFIASLIAGIIMTFGGASWLVLYVINSLNK